MNDKIYPDDWLCKECQKTFSEHVQKGTPNEEGPSPILLATKNWCYKWEEVNTDTKPKQFSFQPVDNLTLIEIKAKQKGIV